jgi:2-methylcitrate dehydratase PrpD
MAHTFSEESGVSREPASQRIAEFVTAFDSDSLSDERVHTVARAFLDTYAVALAGQREPASQLVLDYARRQGQPDDWSGSIWSTGELLPIESVALVNGTMSHVLDYDDLTSPLRAHLSVALLPLLVALSEASGATGRQLSAAYVAGFEVACKLALPMVSEHYAKGWHSTSSVGVLGATAAGAHLLGLTAEQTINALGLAVAQASGTRENFGTMAKSFQAGHCGAVSARALALAQLGFTASPFAIDGASGYLKLYAQQEDVRATLDQLGTEPLELEACGADIKKYPLCYATHHVIDGILDLRAEYGFSLADISGVEIETNLHGLKPLLHHRPQTGLEAKFSMEYAVAAAIEDGQVTLSSFEDDEVLRTHIQEFFPKVQAVEASVPAMPRWASITLHMVDGQELHKRVEQLRGGVELPLTDDELTDKVRDCLAFARRPVAAESIVEAVFSWVDQPVSTVLNAIRRRPAVTRS